MCDIFTCSHAAGPDTVGAGVAGLAPATLPPEGEQARQPALVLVPRAEHEDQGEVSKVQEGWRLIQLTRGGGPLGRADRAGTLIKYVWTQTEMDLAT